MLWNKFFLIKSTGYINFLAGMHFALEIPRHWGVQMSLRLMLIQFLWRHNEIRTHPDWRICSGLRSSLCQQQIGRAKSMLGLPRS
jgi:hypothetical protein